MKLRLTGITPLIMHNVRLADPDEPVVRQIAAITAKKSNMTEAERLEVARLKFFGGMYYDDSLGPYLPCANIFASLIAAARKFRKGPDIEDGVFWLAEKAVLEYDGPRDPEKMWNGGDSPFVDRRIVTIDRKSRVPGIRPIFPNWAAETHMDFDENILDLADLTRYLQRAGRVGVGDYRRVYGKYSVEISG